MTSTIHTTPPSPPAIRNFAKNMKRKRCLEMMECTNDSVVTRPKKKGLTMQMKASLALLQHLPALQVSGTRMGRRGAVDVGDCMIHALGAVLHSTAQVTRLVSSTSPRRSIKVDEERASVQASPV